MHQVDEDGETCQLRNLAIRFEGGSMRLGDEYLVFLDELCDSSKYIVHRNTVQFTHLAGLARAALTGGALGALMIGHLVIGLIYGGGSLGIARWCIYAVMLCVYHWSEFLVTMRYNGAIASCESFLLDQSRAFHIAIVSSWIEFWVEFFLFPGLKGSSTGSVICFVVGFFLVLMGQFFRTGAMVSGKSNFTHLIQFSKTKTHQLVTTGLYEYSRHPSYFGWFWWSIGTQLLVCNPVCAVGFTFAAWKFFHDRIPIEEEALIKFFPKEYPAYKAKTPVGIPFL